MQIKFLRLIAGLACVSLFNWGCTKIDSTVLGEDLIPAVDNVSTFADTLAVIATREQNVDTTGLRRSETHVLGNINNDPVFGKTKADIFLELKPSAFPFYFGNSGDIINHATDDSTHFDSAFVCLSYTAFYGDTDKVQHLKVYQLDENTSDFIDTVTYKFNFKPTPYPTNMIGEADVYEPDLKKYVFLKTTLKDSVTKQIRIKLNNSFLAAFVQGDSAADMPNNFFRNDSIFKTKYKGFAIVADGNSAANGLFYVSLTDALTRLEVFYTARSGGKIDTAFSSFPLSVGTYASISASANANALKRDTATSEFPVSADPAAVYIQSAPGSAIRLTIPKLDSLSNRIVHRAEIFLEQVPGSPGNDVLTAPLYLYLDLIDDTGKRYKPVYYDLSPNESYNPDFTTSGFFPSAVDNGYYGGYLRSTTDGWGKRSYYTFNLTRYVQNLLTKKGTSYKFRVYAPYNLTYYGLNLAYKNNLAYGRVKIYNGSDSTHRIRMRIVYSKI